MARFAKKIPTPEKACTRCRIVKPLNRFHGMSKGYDGKQPKCITCMKELDSTPQARERRRAYTARFRKSPHGSAWFKEYESSTHGRRIKRASQIRRQFGLDDEDLARMYDSQDRKCPGCSSPLLLDSETHIDHCHATGVVRGLLCRGCNTALGLVRDKPDAMRRLADYLELHGAKR